MGFSPLFFFRLASKWVLLRPLQNATHKGPLFGSSVAQYSFSKHSWLTVT